MRKEIASLRRHISLPEEEWYELESKFDHYRQTISELIEQTTRSEEYIEEIGHLDSEIARLKYKMYDTHMAVFTNAVKLSGLVAESELEKKKLPIEISTEIDRILEKYLM